jgi:hypothetical protein
MKARAAVPLGCVVSLLLLSIVLTAQQTPNSDGNYQQLRNIALQPGGITIENVTLKRDAATFQLRSGTLCFVAPVNNKVTGAVFVGEGKLLLDPPVPSERAILSVVSKEKEYVESFDHLVLRFTDGTYDELKSAGKPRGAWLRHRTITEQRKGDAQRHELQSRRARPARRREYSTWRTLRGFCPRD